MLYGSRLIYTCADQEEEVYPGMPMPGDQFPLTMLDIVALTTVQEQADASIAQVRCPFLPHCLI